MEFVSTDEIHPEWNLYEQFIIQRWLSVMQDDAISFSHPVNMKLTRNEQLTTIFDTITYSKGSSLIRMMTNFMSTENFNKGITNYLQKHLYSNAKQTDLWESLDKQLSIDNITVEMIMNTWTNQMGYPYIQIERDYTNNIATITQHQFLFHSEAQSPPSIYKYLWYIPFQLKDSSDIQWLNESQMNITIQSNQWILANPNLFGFFRTNYDEQNWKMIIEQLKIDHEKCTVIERAGLIDDAFNLARAGYSNLIEFSLNCFFVK